MAAEGDLLGMFGDASPPAAPVSASAGDGSLLNMVAAPVPAADHPEEKTIRPVCLISQQGTGESCSLKIHEEGLEVLRGLGTTPVATLSVAGMYRTGKSFFLNQLMGQSGFVVGNTTTSCTRGIWLWLAPPGVWDAPAQKAGAALLVLDTEGLSSFDQDETYDAKIFSLGILLSSFFIYNSMGVIDEAAIDRLFLVGELTKNIGLSTVKARAAGEMDGEGGGAAVEGGDGEEGGAEGQGGVSEADLAQFFPPFLWVLRDFSLKLKDGDGSDISLHQYLETALEDRRGTSRRVTEGNRIRQSFRALFKERECLTMVRPVHEEEQLQTLSALPASALREEFRTQMEAAKQKIFSRVAPKTVFGEVVTGAGLAMLSVAYVQAINDGAVPDIRKSWDYVVEETLRLAYEAATASFHDGFRQHCEGVITAAAAGGVGLTALPCRAELAKTATAKATAADELFVEKGGAMIAPELPGPWKVKLSDDITAATAAGTERVSAASHTHCAELASTLLKRTLQVDILICRQCPVNFEVFMRAISTIMFNNMQA